MEGNNVPHSHKFRTLNHPNLLALLGVIFAPDSVTLITNLVRGKDLHHMIFGRDEALDVDLFSSIIIPHVCSQFFNADDICS